MNQTMLSQIEDTFKGLSFSDQLLLIEHLVHQMNQSALKEDNNLDKQLALMAADPEIQTELKKIEQEFAYAENDGLENL